MGPEHWFPLLLRAAVRKGPQRQLLLFARDLWAQSAGATLVHCIAPAGSCWAEEYMLNCMGSSLQTHHLSTAKPAAAVHPHTTATGYCSLL